MIIWEKWNKAVRDWHNQIILNITHYTPQKESEKNIVIYIKHKVRH